MSGGPAQLDTFDYKPQVGSKPHPGSVVSFAQRGQSGVHVSELLPNIARHADKLCVLNAMYADTGNHAQSFLQLHTGDRLRPCPSLGSWVSYGLGTENANLPSFMVIAPALPYAGAQVWSADFLPGCHQGTRVVPGAEPVPNINRRVAEIGRAHV